MRIDDPDSTHTQRERTNSFENQNQPASPGNTHGRQSYETELLFQDNRWHRGGCVDRPLNSLGEPNLWQPYAVDPLKTVLNRQQRVDGRYFFWHRRAIWDRRAEFDRDQ